MGVKLTFLALPPSTMVIVFVAVRSPLVAVRVTVPVPIAISLPLEKNTTESSEDVHCTFVASMLTVSLTLTALRLRTVPT